jgi:hypothetical protein
MNDVQDYCKPGAMQPGPNVRILAEDLPAYPNVRILAGDRPVESRPQVVLTVRSCSSSG